MTNCIFQIYLTIQGNNIHQVRGEGIEPSAYPTSRGRSTTELTAQRNIASLIPHITIPGNSVFIVIIVQCCSTSGGDSLSPHFGTRRLALWDFLFRSLFLGCFLSQHFSPVQTEPVQMIFVPLSRRP